MTDEFSDSLPRPGDLIGGKWRIGALLGQGGMGMVYSARHDTLGRTVAVKFLRPGELEDPESIARFLREAKVAGLADHPGIARVIDFAETDDEVPYLVMELLDGHSLQDLLRRTGGNRLKLSTGLEILISVLETLQFIHERDIVHRDLKPANIFCRRDGDRMQTKIFDFGIARSTSPGDVLPHLTDRATVVGTPYYTSPEQAQGHQVGPQTDLWSVGVIMYYMATGKLPFTGKTGMEVYAKVLMQEPPPVCEVNPELPPSIENIIAMALAKPPLHRFKNAQVMAEALRSLAAEVTESSLLVTSRRHSKEVPNPVALETVRAVPPQLLRDAMLPQHESGDAGATSAKRGTGLKGALIAMVALIIAGTVGWFVAGGGRDSGATKDEAGGPVAKVDSRAGDGDRGASGADAGAAKATSEGDRRPKPELKGPGLTMVWTPYSDPALLRKEARWVVDEFERATGRPIKLIVPKSYDETVGMLLRGEAEFASLSPNSYVMAKTRNKHLELLVRHLIDGGPSYQSLCLTKQTSGVTSLMDLKGKQVCFVDPASTSGYVYPRILFREAAVDIEVDLGKRIFSGGHSKALQTMFDDGCAAACVASSELTRWANNKKVRLGAFRILATSDAIPGDAIVMRPDLDDALKASLRKGGKLLIARSKAGEVPSEMVITGFVDGADADYDSIRKVQAGK